MINDMLLKIKYCTESVLHISIWLRQQYSHATRPWATDLYRINEQNTIGKNIYYVVVSTTEVLKRECGHRIFVTKNAPLCNKI